MWFEMDHMTHAQALNALDFLSYVDWFSAGLMNQACPNMKILIFWAQCFV